MNGAISEIQERGNKYSLILAIVLISQLHNKVLPNNKI